MDDSVAARDFVHRTVGAAGRAFPAVAVQPQTSRRDDFFLALVHAGLATFRFHALETQTRSLSVLTAYRADYDPFNGPAQSLAQFPFEPFGAIALVILFLMAATSHDFWLRNLGASFWKLMHMFVYGAYGALIVHVSFGALQSEHNPLYIACIALGAFVVVVLHLFAYRKEVRTDRARSAPETRQGVHSCVSRGKDR